jgi:hypothetical protein
MHAETHSNSVPLVSWPLAAPLYAKCAYFECLNLGVQSTEILKFVERYLLIS